MSVDVIWALDQRDRCIACPSKPVANAVVLHLSPDGSLARDAVAQWAGEGAMAAGVAWPGAGVDLSADDWLDLEDAVTGLVTLASVVAVVGEGDARDVADQLGQRIDGLALTGEAERPRVLSRLRAIAAT